MGPKKIKLLGKKKNKKYDEEQFCDQDQIIQSWNQTLQESKNNQNYYEKQQEQDYQTKKSAFQYGIHHYIPMQLPPQPPKPQRDKYADYTEQQLQQLKKLQQKAKQQKQYKTQIKNEKRKERKKQKQAQKLIQQLQKLKQQEMQKKVQQQLKKQQKNQSNPYLIPISLILFLILMFVLQYQKQLFQRFSKFQQTDLNYYQILQVDESITDKQLKNKYKKLVLKYHPDRNPDCQTCKQKFNKIITAWQILGDPQKRKNYDQNTGFISQLKSSSFTLTPHNYHYLVEQYNNIWMIQVFDSTHQYSRYFLQFWEELVTQYYPSIKFGRIDIWHQSDMTNYIPYKFQIFPSIYILDNGYSQICTFNFQHPLDGLKKCIQSSLNNNIQYKQLKEVPKNISNISQNNKIAVYLDKKLSANIYIKAYNKKYYNTFQYYFIDKLFNKKVLIVFNNKQYVFNFTQLSLKKINSYSQFLQSFIIQEVSTCAFIHQCQQKKCILIINRTRLQKISQQLPLINQEGNDPLSIYILTDNQYNLDKQIKLIQDKENHYQNYDIGMYEDGRIDLGYANEVYMLNPEEGERLDLECRVVSWKQRVVEFFYNRFWGNREES